MIPCSQASTLQRSEKLKQLMKPSNQESIYHNYNQQKLHIKHQPSHDICIQPLSKLLNLNLNTPINDKQAQAKLRNYSSSSQQTFQSTHESNTIKPDIQNITSSKVQITQFMKKNYQNGIYFGQMNAHNPHGEGGFFWDNGCFYYGKSNYPDCQWRDGCMHGCGLYIFKTGSLLRGNFKKGMVNGLAELSFFSSFQQQILNGFWIQGQFEGTSPAQFYQKGVTQSFEKISTLFDHQEEQSSQPLFVGIFPELKQQEQEIDGENLSHQFQVNPYYYDNELKKKLLYYVACENSIEVGERKNNQLNGLAIKFYFDGKIEYGSFKKGLLEGRAKILFKTGDIYDGYFINSAFQGPGVYFNNLEKVWAYGAFSKNKIMYLQQQNSTYPPPALYDLREKDENVDSSDRLIGENQMRDRNIISDIVLTDSMQSKANGDQIFILPSQTIQTQQTQQTLQTSQTQQQIQQTSQRQKSEQSQQTCQTQQTQQNEEESIQSQQVISSPFQVVLESTKSRYNSLQISNDMMNQGGLRKTADFGNTIKNLSTLFQAPYHQEMEQIKENSMYQNNFSCDGERKSIQEKIIEKQLEMEDDNNNNNNNSQQHATNHQSHPTHQTMNGLTPRSYNFLSARHITSINADCPQTNYASDNLEYPKETSQRYYGISEETYQIIKELEQQEVLQKKRDKSSEKITKIKALISSYLSKPTANAATSALKYSFDQTPTSRQNQQQSNNKAVYKVNNENINPHLKRTPSTVASSSTRNLFSASMSNQNSKSKPNGRESFSKQTQLNSSNKQNANFSSCINIGNNNVNNILQQNHNVTNQNQNAANQNQNATNQNIKNNNGQICQQNASKSPLRQSEVNQQSRNSLMKRQQLFCQMSSEKNGKSGLTQQINNSQVQPKLNSQNKSNRELQRPKNYSQQFEPKSIMQAFQSDQMQKAFQNNCIQKYQIDTIPITTPYKTVYSNHAQTPSTAKANLINDFSQHFFFTQSCRNHKRNVSSINFSTSNVSQNQMKQKVGQTQIQQKKSHSPLNIQIY